MEFKILENSYLEQAVNLAIANYEEEAKYHNVLYKKDYRQDIEKALQNLFSRQNGILAVEGEKLVGYLAFAGTWQIGESDFKATISPVYGYGIAAIKRERMMSMLFQKAAEALVKQGIKNYEVKVYAHDQAALSAYVMNQFGILCTDTIRDVEETTDTETHKEICYETLSKAQIEQCKSELLHLYRSLVDHLRQSPAFYPGEEFTDQVYIEYILDEATDLFVARAGKEIIGILDANSEGNCFVTDEPDTINVGDIYVKPEYRGKKIAQGLLQYANDYLKAKGAKRLWVEHGTVNPNARGFWDKYFSSFSYTLSRDLDARIFK